MSCLKSLEVRTEYLEATLGLVKRLEISKELMLECVTVPGCCCCMPLLHNHLMDSCSYVRKNTLLAAKGGCICTPLTPLNPPLEGFLFVNCDMTEWCAPESQGIFYLAQGSTSFAEKMYVTSLQYIPHG